MQEALRLDAVSKVHGKGAAAVAALREITLSFPKGGLTAVMGPSGSGKTTLLQCAAGLDTPTAGKVTLAGQDLTGMSERRRTELRRAHVGFVFQSYNLLPSLDVAQNIALPLRLAGRRADRAHLDGLLERVGLAGRARARATELSGGQQQRVALARALITRPDIVFGDEPTGALDTVTAHQILTLLREIVDGTGQTVVMVTHDPVAASFADRALLLAAGRVVDELAAPTADAVAARMTRLGAWT